MASVTDVYRKKLLSWDTYKNKSPDEALPSIYTHAEEASSKIRDWYWGSIRKKKHASLFSRSLAFGFLILGTAFPIVAGVLDDTSQRLSLTQWAVAFLAVAGLTQVADRVFGWSSGWMRYITTVTTMENLTRVFELEWAKYLVARDAAALDSSDVRALFELAKGLEQELIKLQDEETTKWVAEFNTSLSLLESLIKSQREEVDKKLESIRTTISAKEAAAKEEEKTKRVGSVEVSLVHKDKPKAVRISLDEDPPDEFLGRVWSKLDVKPGQHVVIVQTLSDPPESSKNVVDVPPGGVARVEIKVGS